MKTSEWAIYDVRGNSSGTYYVVNVQTKGTMIAPVTVKHTKHDTYCCLTCLTADLCPHSRFVREYAEQDPNVT